MINKASEYAASQMNILNNKQLARRPSNRQDKQLSFSAQPGEDNFVVQPFRPTESASRGMIFTGQSTLDVEVPPQKSERRHLINDYKERQQFLQERNPHHKTLDRKCSESPIY